MSHQRGNMHSDQRSLGFRVGHCHVQLTGVDILPRRCPDFVKFWIQHILKCKLCFAGHDLECFKCVSSKSWDDCDSNKQVMTSPSSYDVCGKISYEEKSKGVPSKFFVEACWAYSKCNRGVCRKEASKSVTIDKRHVTCCKSDLCNGAKVPMVSALLLLACALATFFC